MSKKDFLLKNIGFLKKDDQEVFRDLGGVIEGMADKNVISETVQVGADGNWFTVSFDAIDVKKDRLVINAKRVKDGLRSDPYDPSIKQYIVEFEGTRAAYLRGFYKSRHPRFGWSYISWDIRSYANHPRDKNQRVYVAGFRASNEIRRLILAMERATGASHILNSYINDNLLRFQTGILARKTPEQIEKEWSQGMMEGLGYYYVEGFDHGIPKGKWNDVQVHWCKDKSQLSSFNER